MTTPHKIFPHGDFEAIGPNLWRVVGSLPMPLKRTMYVHKLADGGLLIYSAIALNDAGMAALEALGPPKVLVISHPMHLMDATFYKSRYPALRVFGSADAQARLPALKFDASAEDGLRELGLKSQTVPGMKLTEVAMEVPVDGGVGLIVTDIFAEPEGETGLLLKLLGPPGGSGVARIVKWRQIGEKERVRAWLNELSTRADLKLLGGCHGGIVRSDCAGWLSAAAAGM